MVVKRSIPFPVPPRSQISDLPARSPVLTTELSQLHTCNYYFKKIWNKYGNQKKFGKTCCDYEGTGMIFIVQLTERCMT
jgi:hypothetical protein